MLSSSISIVCGNVDFVVEDGKLVIIDNGEDRKLLLQYDLWGGNASI